MRRLQLAASVAVLFALLPGSASAADMSPELKAVAKAADAEGSMKIVWVSEILGGGRGLKMVQDGMNTMFGTKVEIKFAPGGSMPQVGNQIASEYKAGRPATSDVYMTSLNNATRLSGLGIFRPVEWTKLLPGRITDEMVEADGAALRFVSTITSVAYNKNLVPNPPKTLAGWLAPEFKGKLASTAYAAGFDALGASDVWGPAKSIEFAKALSGQLSGLIGCADNHRIASGEFAALIMACGGGVRQMIEKGAPLGLVTPQDYTSSAFFYLLVPKNAASPNAATLMVTYMMTPEGQNIAWDQDRSDLHMFPESRMAAEVRDVQNSGAKVIVQSIKWAREHPEKEETLREITKIFTRH
jgi:ABC-type Fe3+ transport system substrate-binding protein